MPSTCPSTVFVKDPSRAGYQGAATRKSDDGPLGNIGCSIMWKHLQRHTEQTTVTTPLRKLPR